jgi:predicted kinase
MAKLWITRGLPASGKSTWARKQLATRTLGEIVRLNRDDLRRMALDPSYRQPVYAAERRISAARDAALGALLGSGCDVIVDDTNLRAKFVRELMAVAAKAGAEVEVVDFLDVPLGECVRRDQERDPMERVGWQVIHDMHSRYLAQLNGGPLPVPTLTEGAEQSVQPYTATPGTPKAVLCDLDGTLALLNGRNPYDESCVIHDLPNRAVIETLRALIDAGHAPVFMSGRTEACRADTATWLIEHVCPEMARSAPELHMRTVGDSRPDHVVKLELFDARVRDRYDVHMVLDDRNSVVALWRSMGLTCLQVADGDF